MVINGKVPPFLRCMYGNPNIESRRLAKLIPVLPLYTAQFEDISNIFAISYLYVRSIYHQYLRSFKS
jgi:hypothetical protein